MTSVFISHNHKDNLYIDAIKSTVKNPNHELYFHNNSLAKPVYNSYGHINRRPPSDPLSTPVKNEINKLLSTTDKLLVLLGNDTHSKEWVTWEIKSFVSKNGWGEILLMRTPDNIRGGAPEIANHLHVHDWNMDELSKWIFR